MRPIFVGSRLPVFSRQEAQIRRQGTHADGKVQNFKTEDSSMDSVMNFHAILCLSTPWPSFPGLRNDAQPYLQNHVGKLHHSVVLLGIKVFPPLGDRHGDCAWLVFHNAYSNLS